MLTRNQFQGEFFAVFTDTSVTVRHSYLRFFSPRRATSYVVASSRKWKILKLARENSLTRKKKKKQKKTNTSRGNRPRALLKRPPSSWDRSREFTRKIPRDGPQRTRVFAFWRVSKTARTKISVRPIRCRAWGCRTRGRDLCRSRGAALCALRVHAIHIKI